MNGPTVSIIIVAWNSREAVLRCLQSLEALGRLPFSLETIVVDNFSDDGTIQALMVETETIARVGLKLLPNPRNVGLSTATEQAYKITSGKWVLLCNPDVVFTDDFIGMMSFAMSQDSFSILAAEMVNHDGSLQRVVVRRFPTVARIFFGFSILGSGVDLYLLRRFFSDDYTYARTRFIEPVTSVDQPGASFLLLSRAAIDKMGGIFSAEFPIWWNDVDLAKRAERAGIMRGIMPGVRIPHELGHSAKKLPKPTRRYIFCQSMVRYCRKWKMHPRLIQALFVIDGVLNIIGGWPLWSAQIGLGRGTRECWAYGMSQVRGILTG
jgi:GT2 family glycosyltransferase